MTLTLNVTGHPDNTNLGLLTTTPLTMTEAELCLLNASLHTPRFGPSNFTIDFYLSAMLRILSYGQAGGGPFRLAIERQNMDLRRLVAECIGATTGAMLCVRDLGVDLSTLGSCILLTSNPAQAGREGDRTSSGPGPMGPSYTSAKARRQRATMTLAWRRRRSKSKTRRCAELRSPIATTAAHTFRSSTEGAATHASAAEIRSATSEKSRRS